MCSPESFVSSSLLLIFSLSIMPKKKVIECVCVCVSTSVGGDGTTKDGQSSRSGYVFNF